MFTLARRVGNSTRCTIGGVTFIRAGIISQGSEIVLVLVFLAPAGNRPTAFTAEDAQPATLSLRDDFSVLSLSLSFSFSFSLSLVPTVLSVRLRPVRDWGRDGGRDAGLLPESDFLLENDNPRDRLRLGGTSSSSEDSAADEDSSETTGCFVFDLFERNEPKRDTSARGVATSASRVNICIGPLGRESSKCLTVALNVCQPTVQQKTRDGNLLVHPICLDIP